MSWPKGIVRVSAHLGTGKRGTGTVIAPKLVLTALHVITSKLGEVPADETSIQIEFVMGSRLPARVHGNDFSVEDDWVVLHCPDAPADAEPLRADLRPAHGDWTSYGFPNANPDGLHVDGTIAGTYRYEGRSDALQLESPKLHEMWVNELSGNANARQLEGMSGAPILIEGRVVGIMRAHLPRVGTAYASVIAKVPYIQDALGTELAGLAARLEALIGEELHPDRSVTKLRAKYEHLIAALKGILERLPPGDARWDEASNLRAEAESRVAGLQTPTASPRASAVRWVALAVVVALVAVAGALAVPWDPPVMLASRDDAGVDDAGLDGSFDGGCPPPASERMATMCIEGTVRPANPAHGPDSLGAGVCRRSVVCEAIVRQERLLDDRLLWRVYANGLSAGPTECACLVERDAGVDGGLDVGVDARRGTCVLGRRSQWERREDACPAHCVLATPPETPSSAQIRHECQHATVEFCTDVDRVMPCAQ